MKCYDKNPAVWSNQLKHLPDYTKFVLRNGQIDENTFESYLNNSNTEFLENHPKGAQYLRQHQFKQIREPFIFDEMGNIELDDSMKEELLAKKDGLETDRGAMLLALIQQYPEIKDRDEINLKIEQIKREVPQSVPNRQFVIDNLVRDFILSKYRSRLGILSAGETTMMENMQQRTGTLQDVLQRLTNIEVAQGRMVDLEEERITSEIGRQEREREEMEQMAFTTKPVSVKEEEEVGVAVKQEEPQDVGVTSVTEPRETDEAPMDLRLEILTDLTSPVGKTSRNVQALRTWIRNRAQSIGVGDLRPLTIDTLRQLRTNRDIVATREPTLTNIQILDRALIMTFDARF